MDILAAAQQRKLHAGPRPLPLLLYYSALSRMPGCLGGKGRGEREEADPGDAWLCQSVLCDEGHKGLCNVEQSIKGIHQHLHAARTGLGNSVTSELRVVEMPALVTARTSLATATSHQQLLLKLFPWLCIGWHEVTILVEARR